MFHCFTITLGLSFKSKVTRISVSGNIRITNRKDLPNLYFNDYF